MPKYAAMHQVDFRVPKSRQGRNFIKLCRLYINRDKWGQVDSRTRGPRDPGSNGQATQEQATSFALYFRESKAHKMWLAKISEDATNYLSNREFRKVSEEYETLLLQEHAKISNLEQGMSLQYKELGNQLKAIHRWEITTLVMFVLGIVIGYMSNV